MTDAAKIKKRKQGRCLKIMGDLSLMINCFNDALGYYNQSVEILKSNYDFLWYASSLEGISAVLLAKNYLLKDFINPAMESDLLFHKEKANEQV